MSSTSAPVGSIAVRNRSSPYAGTGVTRWNGLAWTRRTRRLRPVTADRAGADMAG